VGKGRGGQPACPESAALFQQAEEQQSRERLEERLKELEAALAEERTARVQEREAAKAQAQELFDRLQAAEEASRELWADAAIVLAEQQGTPEEIACVMPNASTEGEGRDVRALVLNQLPGEEAAVEQRFEAAVTLATKLQQLRDGEACANSAELQALQGRCHRHEQYLEILERAKQQPKGRGPNRNSRDMIVSKIATCLARGYSVKEGTLSEVQLLRRQLNEAALAKIAGEAQ